MEFFDITRLKSVEVKLEMDWAVINNELNEATSDDEGTLTEELKHEVGSDYENNPKQEYINVYDDMIDVDDVKVEISDILDNVGGETAGEWNDGRNKAPSSEDIPLSQRLRSRKRVRLNDDTEVINNELNEATSDDEGTLTEELKHEVGSDYENNPKQEYINVYDDMIDVDDVKVEISDILDNVGGETAGEWNDGRNKAPSSEDIPLSQRLRSRKRVRLNDDTEDRPPYTRREEQKLMVSEHLSGNTDRQADKLQTTNEVISETHLKTRSTDKVTQFVCDTCHHTFKCKSHLKQHLLIHTGEKPFSCNKCDYKCYRKGSLKQHLLTHTGEKPFSCDKCDYKCNHKGSLKHHLLTHTGEKRFSCNKCDYKCYHKHKLKQHLLTHTGEKPFSCNKCDYKCSLRQYLKQHLLTHTVEKPFSCNKCDYKCYKKGNLKQHLLTHTGEKPFSCNKCDFKCNQKGSLKQHLLTHTGEKPFSCDKCDYKYNHKGSLKQHLLTHTGKKPFSCDKCDYRCSVRQHLKQHLFTHTGEKTVLMQ